MDPDIVRQQEEAEREANAAAQKKLANEPAKPSQPAVVPQPAAKTPELKNSPAVSKIKAELPPMGSGRQPGEASAKPRRLRGLLRLFVYALAGGALGAAAGYAAMLYMNLFPADQASFYIPVFAGGFALILGLVHLFHYDTR